MQDNVYAHGHSMWKHGLLIKSRGGHEIGQDLHGSHEIGRALHSLAQVLAQYMRVTCYSSTMLFYYISQFRFEVEDLTSQADL